MGYADKSLQRYDKNFNFKCRILKVFLFFSYRFARKQTIYAARSMIEASLGFRFRKSPATA